MKRGVSKGGISPELRTSVPVSADVIEYGQFVRRALRGYTNRVGQGDEPELQNMVELMGEFELRLAQAIGLQMSVGRNWQYIADIFGITRQAARGYWKPRVEAAMIRMNEDAKNLKPGRKLWFDAPEILDYELSEDPR